VRAPAARRTAAVGAALAAGASIGCGVSGARSREPAADSLPSVAAARATDHAAEVDSARRLLRELAHGGAGLAVGVSVGGRVVWLEGLGYADLEARRPVDPRTTRFQVYSVSKGLTTLAAASLVEDGRLDLGAPVRSYLPGFPDKGAPITPAELLAHTSGIRHYSNAVEASSRRHCDVVADAVPIFEDDPLVHPPGAARTYSSWGYVLLSRVLEAAADEPFRELVRRRILEPSGAALTVIDDPDARIPGRATFYSVPTGGGPEPTPEVDNTCKWGAGAYLSTARDLVAVYRALLGGDLLAPHTLRSMVLRGAEPDSLGRQILEISGWGEGAAAFTAADLDTGVVVVLLSNAIGPDYGPRVQRAFGRLRTIFDPGP